MQTEAIEKAERKAEALEGAAECMRDTVLTARMLATMFDEYGIDYHFTELTNYGHGGAHNDIHVELPGASYLDALGLLDHLSKLVVVSGPAEHRGRLIAPIMWGPRGALHVRLDGIIGSDGCEVTNLVEVHFRNLRTKYRRYTNPLTLEPEVSGLPELDVRERPERVRNGSRGGWFYEGPQPGTARELLLLDRLKEVFKDDAPDED